MQQLLLTRLDGSDDPSTVALHARAAADALMVLLHADFHVFARPTSAEFAHYHSLVKDYAATPELHALTLAPAAAHPLDAATERLFLDTRLDTDLARLRDPLLRVLFR